MKYCENIGLVLIELTLSVNQKKKQRKEDM